MVDYDFHYSFINKYFDAEVSFTDTDSLTYEVLLIFIKTQKITDKKDFHKKKRFSQMIINKKRFKKILIKRIDYHR